MTRSPGSQTHELGLEHTSKAGIKSGQ